MMYQLTLDPTIIHNCETGEYISRSHRSWIAYEEWLESGGVPIPAIRTDVEEALVSRNELLRSSDWTQIPDAPLTQIQKEKWAVYRQSLRDLPSLNGFPSVPWPIPPALDGVADEIKAPM